MYLTDLKKAVDAAVKSAGSASNTIPVVLMQFDMHGAPTPVNRAGGQSPLERAEIVNRGGTAFCLHFG